MQKADYIELRKKIEEKGLLAHTEWYYLVHFLVTIILFAILLGLIVYLNRGYAALPLIVPLAFVTTHFGYLGHEAGHRAVSKRNWINELFGHVSYGLILGGSFSYWKFKHNQHHAHPNIEGSDPDIDVSPFSLTVQRALEKKGLKRLATRFQAWLFPSVFLILAFLMRGDALRYLYREKKIRIDWLLLLGHVLLFFGILPYFIGIWMSLLIYAVLSMLIGIYLGFTFTPNHVGMPILEGADDLSFLEKQVRTSRNIKSGILLNYIFGGLDCQIEHHLFPQASRKNLLRIRSIVKEYCIQHNVPYRDESIAAAWKGIFKYLDTMGRYARRFPMLKMAHEML